MVALRVGLVVCNGFTHAHDTVNMIDLGIDTDPYLDFSKPYVGPYLDFSKPYAGPICCFLRDL
jgi:hypothetical protein